MTRARPLLRVEDGKVVIDTDLCQAVIFDMDGVITDSVPVHRRAWKETLSRLRPTARPAPVSFVDGCSPPARPACACVVARVAVGPAG